MISKLLVQLRNTSYPKLVKIIKYAPKAIIKNITTDLRFPPPIRTRVLFPQPEPIVIPIPKINPPRTYLNQANVEVLYGGLAVSLLWVNVPSIKPNASKKVTNSSAEKPAKPRFQS